MIKINLGCGSRRLPDPWVNCDHAEFAKPDMRFDFGRDPWPFAAQSADQIDARHCLEHSTGINHVMVEAYRVLVPGGRFEIEVPHPRSDWFIGDSTHVMPITQATLDLYSKAWCEDCQANNSANTPLALHLGVNFRMIENESHLNEHWIKTLLHADQKMIQRCVATYNNVLDGMRFVLERV